MPFLTKAVELKNDVPAFHNNLGMALEHTGQFKAAAKAYDGAVTAALVPPAAFGQAEPSAPGKSDKTLSPYFFVDGGDPAVDHLPLEDTRVDVAVSGVIADVTVKQVYENRGSRPIHARYVFPASTRAAVYGMTMTIGNVRIVAKIKERQKARIEFEAAKKKGKSASLLEQSRPNVFTMNVANVLPGDAIEVGLKYTGLLVPTEGVYEFVYPIVVGPRYSSTPASEAAPEDAFVETPYTHEGEAPRSEFHLAASSPPACRSGTSSRVASGEVCEPQHRTHRDRARRLGAAVGQPRLLPPLSARRRSDQRRAAPLPRERGNDENFFLLMAEPPDEVTPADLPAREYIFVLDVSGSMNGFPLDTGKALMRDLASVLRPTDRFNVVVFADGGETFLPASVPATPQNLSRVDDSNFFAFGIGSGVNRFLIEGVARAGLGEAFIVTNPDEAPEAAATLRHYIDSPVLTNIDVSFSGFDADDVEPRKLPDLFASRPIVVFGKWRGHAGGSIDISGHTGRGPYKTSLAIGAANADEQHSALRHLTEGADDVDQPLVRS